MQLVLLLHVMHRVHTAGWEVTAAKARSQKSPTYSHPEARSTHHQHHKAATPPYPSCSKFEYQYEYECDSRPFNWKYPERENNCVAGAGRTTRVPVLAAGAVSIYIYYLRLKPTVPP